MPRPTRALVALLALALPLLVAASGCSSLQGTGDKGYISENGRVTMIDPADRGDPVELSGTTLDGEPLSLEQLRGKPVVVNFWGSWCADCRTEAADLVAAHDKLGDAAHFVGVNLRDPSVAPAEAFVRRYDVPFPSLYDPNGQALLAFPGSVSLRATPTTLVLDAEGRVAASIAGPVPSTLTLTDVVEDVADPESSTGATGGSADG